MTSSQSIDSITGPTQGSQKAIWEQAVLEISRNKCSNCGGSDRVRPTMIVPEEAGGQYVISNGAAVCRPCALAADATRQGRAHTRKRPLNFWVSRALYDRIQEGLKAHAAFDSMAGLIRFLMGSYVSDESRFDDLEHYQEDGTDVKVNVWVEEDRYATFKTLVDKRGLTVTDAVKALVRLYEEQSESLIASR